MLNCICVDKTLTSRAKSGKMKVDSPVGVRPLRLTPLLYRGTFFGCYWRILLVRRGARPEGVGRIVATALLLL